jgi:S1-C subfamily serine protease
LVFGDVVEAIDDRPVDTPRTFRILVSKAVPGSVLMMRLVRKGETLEVPVSVASSAPVGDTEQTPRLGLVLRTRNGQGSEVVSVEPGSAAARAGLAAGDLITQTGDQARPAPADIRRLFAQTAADGWLLVGVMRDDRRLVVALGKL